MSKLGDSVRAFASRRVIPLSAGAGGTRGSRSLGRGVSAVSVAPGDSVSVQVIKLDNGRGTPQQNVLTYARLLLSFPAFGSSFLCWFVEVAEQSQTPTPQLSMMDGTNGTPPGVAKPPTHPQPARYAYAAFIHKPFAPSLLRPHLLMGVCG